MYRLLDRTSDFLQWTSDSLHSSKAIDLQRELPNQSFGSQKLISGHTSDFFNRIGTLQRSKVSSCLDTNATTTAKRLSLASNLDHRSSVFPCNFRQAPFTCNEPPIGQLQANESRPRTPSTPSLLTSRPPCAQRVFHAQSEIDYERASSQLQGETLEPSRTYLNSEQTNSLAFPVNCLTNGLTKPNPSYPTVDNCGEVKSTAAELVRLTLADYLDQLDRSGKQLKPVSKLTPPHRLTGPLESSPHAQKGDTGLLNHPVMKQRINDPQSEPNVLALQTNISSEEYLLKRRSFLITRLAERYSELLQLLQEELELTGRPPEGYNQYLHEWHAAREAAQRLKVKDTSQKNGSTHFLYSELHCDSIPNGTSASKVTNEMLGRYSTYGTCLSTGLLGNRLQETRFPISPVTVRKAGLKLSPSAHCLLVTSRLSLHEDDRISMKNHNALFARPLTDQKNSRVRSLSLIKQEPINLKASSINGGVVRGSWTKRKQAASRAALVNRGAVLHPGVVSLSLTDLRGSQSPSSSDYEIKRLDDSVDSERDGSIEHGKLSTSSALSEPIAADAQHQMQAIAWIDVEIAALHNIMVANLRCAGESSRSKESRRAYKQAARMNELKIARLKKQRELLQALNPNEPEVLSMDSFTISSSADGNSRCEMEFSERQMDGQIDDSSSDKRKLDVDHKNSSSDANCSCSKSGLLEVYHTEPQSRRSTPSLLGALESISCFPSNRVVGNIMPREDMGDSGLASLAYPPDAHQTAVSPKMSWTSTVTTRHTPSSNLTIPTSCLLHTKPSNVATSKSPTSISRRPQLLPRTPYELPTSSFKRDLARIDSNSMLNTAKLDSNSNHHTDSNRTPYGTPEKPMGSKYSHAVCSERPPSGGFSVKLCSYSPASSPILTSSSSSRSTKTGFQSYESASLSKYSNNQSIYFHLPAYTNTERSTERQSLRPLVKLTHAPMTLTSLQSERNRYSSSPAFSPSFEVDKAVNPQGTQISIVESWRNTDQTSAATTHPMSKYTDRRGARTPEITTAPVERPTLIHVVSPKTARRFPTPDLPQSTFNINRQSESCARSLASSHVKIMREVQPSMSSSPYWYIPRELESNVPDQSVTPFDPSV